MSQVIGKSISRKDGRAKVTGEATYGAEHKVANLVHGYLVTATIAKGRISNIDMKEAEASPGVIAVFTHKNAPKIFTPDRPIMSYEERLPLSDDRVNYAGQIVGLVVADTFERARDAAHLVKVEYQTEQAQIDAAKVSYKKAPSLFGEDLEFQEGSFQTGDFSAAKSGAKETVEVNYTTETEIHAPMEPHALVVNWENQNSVTIYEPTQWVKGSQGAYAELLGLPVEKVRIISPYIGGGFGCKAFPWPHGILTVAAARKIQRPLKVVLSRRQMTANTGHRSQTEQTIRLAANGAGKLTAIEHTAKSCTSPVKDFPEPCTVITPVMYAAPNMRLKQEMAVLNVGSPTFMRAPGENPGMFA